MSIYKDYNCNMTSTSSLTQDLPDILANMSAASLYVGDLLPFITEVTLFKKFSPLGTVTSVKLCRDWETGKSLCYAYVNFENPAEAEKAYRTLNYEPLEGQPMRIMKSTRNPWLGSTGCCYQHQYQHQPPCCNKSLVDAKSLAEAIESYSRVKSIAQGVLPILQTLALQESNESKGPTGYKYSSDFLKRMNNQNKFTNVFIKNFRDLLDDYKLERLCRQFGEVVSVKVMVDEYGISKGFGFACFNDPDDAQRAVNKLNGLVLDGRTLYAGPAMTRSQRTDPRPQRYDTDDFRTAQPPQEYRPQTVSSRICIRNLRDLVDDIRLYKEFQRFGTVLQAEVLKTSDGRPKGSGFVDFKDKADAARALNSMNGKAFYGTRISVTYVPHTSTVSTNTGSQEHPYHDDDYNSNKDWDDADKDGPRSVSVATGNDGDNNSSSSGRCNLHQLKNIASSLTDKGHPINIKDIGNFNSTTSVNRNSRELQKYRSVYTTVSTNNSNNSDINTSNNAILATGKDTDDAVRGLTTRDEAAADVRTAQQQQQQQQQQQPQPDDVDDTCASATLCVKNLDESISDEKLENLFTTFGTILSAKVISNEFGISKGFGFVIMSEAQDAVKAIKSLDGRIVVNRPIYVAPAAQQGRPNQKQ